MKINRFIGIVFAVFCVVFSGCDNRKPAPTLTNEAIIYCDRDFEYVMRQQREVYLSDTKNEQITFHFESGEEVQKHLLDGTAQVAVIGRQFSDEELAKTGNIDSVAVRQLAVAKDAVMLVTGKNSSLKSLDFATFLADISRNNSPYILVFDSKQSGIVRSFDFLKKANAQQLFALDSTEAVIDYVNAHESAIGLLPFAKLSDEYNAEMQAQLQKIRILPLKIKSATGQELTVSVSQSEIALNDYPFIRPINFIIAKPHENISRSFLDFLYKKRGEKIFLKAGLIPAVMPGRDFIINSDGINVKKEQLIMSVKQKTFTKIR